LREDAPVTSGPVVVVGAGPTGVTTALALAVHGVPTVVLERRAEVHPLPRAVHLDDEAVRVLQSIGVGPARRPKPTGNEAGPARPHLRRDVAAGAITGVEIFPVGWHHPGSGR